MRQARLLIAMLLAGTAISACATGSDDSIYPPPPPPDPPPPPPPPPVPPPPPPPPVQHAQLVSGEATAAHWFYETSLDGLSHTQRVEHVRRYQQYPVQLPATVNASVGDSLWVAPVCDGRIRWDRAGVYTVNWNLIVPVRC